MLHIWIAIVALTFLLAILSDSNLRESSRRTEGSLHRMTVRYVTDQRISKQESTVSPLQRNMHERERGRFTQCLQVCTVCASGVWMHTFCIHLLLTAEPPLCPYAAMQTHTFTHKSAHSNNNRPSVTAAFGWFIAHFWDNKTTFEQGLSKCVTYGWRDVC